MTTTAENLAIAFAGESQANRKYTAFARKADKEGYSVIARLFRATAEAETIHALGHLAAMDAVGSTAENLAAAIAGEIYEHEEMYPPMLELAEKEGHRAKRMFKWALDVERVHADLYQKAAAALNAGADLEDLEIYICPVCGNIELGRPDEACHVCGLPADKFTVAR